MISEDQQLARNLSEGQHLLTYQENICGADPADM